MNDYRKASGLLYGLIAGVYDLMDRIFFPEGKPNPRKALALGLPTGALKILDVCAGTAATSMAIAQKSPAYSVTGIDRSERMLAVAKRKIAASGLGNLSIQKADATSLPYPDASFDAVTTSLSLHEFPESVRDEILRELRRVLKPKGLLLIIEWDRPDPGLSRAAFNFFPALFEPRGFKEFLNLDWKAWLSAHGFTLENVDRYPFTKLITAIPA